MDGNNLSLFLEKNGHKGFSISHQMSVRGSISSPGQMKSKISVILPLQGLLCPRASLQPPSLALGKCYGIPQLPACLQ